MPLESTMICLDNSDWMRNGDYVPTRLDAQQDAASLLCTARTDSHPENTVGLLTMAGKGVDMLVSPTENISKLMASFAGIEPGGLLQFGTSIQIAQLALKHRKNKNGGQRIIIFVGSPIQEDTKTLEKIAKLLKKNSIAVDVVVIGEHDDIQEKLTDFVRAANSNDNSHLVVVPPGVLPSDALISSPIFQQGSGDDGGLAAAMAASVGGGSTGGGGGGGGDPFAEYGGIDPSMDPELAMAIRISAEEARSQAQSNPTGSSSEETKNADAAPSAAAGGEEDEDALLQAALALSMQDTQEGGDGGVEGEAVDEGGGGDEREDEDEGNPEEDDEEALQLALQMSMAEAQQGDEGGDAAGGVLDADFVNQLLGSVGVDQNDPLMQAALEQLGAAAPSSGDEKRPNPNADEEDDKEGGDSKKRRG